MLLIAIVLMAIMLAWLSIARYEGYNAGMLDLGNMTQAIWSVTQGQPLVFTYVDGPISRLAFHVEWFYLAFVPFYALWPDPRLLLIGQALLFVAGAFPAYQLALRRLDSRFAARCVALTYLFYPVALTAVLFDFHGDTLAMPLLMFALERLDRRAWPGYWLFLGLALSAKFYVAAPVAVLGLLIWWIYGERRVALFTSLIGFGYGLLAFFVIRPLFTTTTTSEAHRGLSYISYYFGQFSELFATLDQRLLSALVVFGPALFLAWRGWRWLLPALPLAAAALLSTGPGGSFDYRYHHYAIVVPFVIMAMVDGAAQLRMAAQQASGRPRRNWRQDLGFTTIIVLLCSVLLVDIPLNPLFWMNLPGRGLDPTAYGSTARDAMKDHFLAEHIPANEPIAASIFLAPHIVNRSTLYLTRYPQDPGAELLPQKLPHVDMVLADALFDFYFLDDGVVSAGPAYEQPVLAHMLQEDDFAVVQARDGLVLFARNPGPQALSQQIAPVSGATADQPARFSFGAAPELLDYTIDVIEPRRLRVEFLWHKPGPIDETLVAVSRLAGVEQMRIVHLPSYALQPVAGWAEGATMRETFEVRLPADLPAGEYAWQLGWYTTSHPQAAWDETRGLIEGSRVETITTLQLP